METDRFQRYIGIDYSGAATPQRGLPGIRVYMANTTSFPREIRPESDSRRHWSRATLHAWLSRTLGQSIPTLVGIDHGFSFPEEYFDVHGLPRHWPTFLEDFNHHWPTAEPEITVEMVRRGERGSGALRGGNARWRRLAEIRCRAKSVFHFDVPGSVAKSTHAGLPWLRLLRREMGPRLHCWPFAGWCPPAGATVIAEAYPSLWNGNFRREKRTPDQHDAFCVTAALRQADRDGLLPLWFEPALAPADRQRARHEGWILGLI